MSDFEKLGLNNNASLEEVETSYNALKKLYVSKMLKTGEEGKKAAQELDKIESAYISCVNKFKQKEREERDKENKIRDKKLFSDVENLINQNQLDEAQNKLNDIIEKNAIWYYFQAKIFEKRNWILPAIEQIKLALSLEPNNFEYQKYYKNLLKIVPTLGKNSENNSQKQSKPDNMNSNSCCLPLSICCCLDSCCI